MANEFYTFGGYLKKDESPLTAAMEDYIEMIYRLCAGNGFTRVNELAQSLNVQPSSATKMAQRLAETGYVKYEKYGFLMLSEKGRQAGEHLLHRHTVIEGFLRAMGVNEAAVLEETEKIEHMLDIDTARCFERFLAFWKSDPELAARFAAYRSSRK